MGTYSPDKLLAFWSPLLKSSAIFAGTLAMAITYLLSPASRAIRTPLELLLARTAGMLLSWFDPSVEVVGSMVTIRGFSAEIVPACTGLFTMSIFLAAVFAYPCKLKHKLLGVALGVLGILALNWIRIVTLLLIGAYHPQAFEFTHLMVWRSLVVFAAALLWLFWVQRFAHA